MVPCSWGLRVPNLGVGDGRPIGHCRRGVSGRSVIGQCPINWQPANICTGCDRHGKLDGGVPRYNIIWSTVFGNHGLDCVRNSRLCRWILSLGGDARVATRAYAPLMEMITRLADANTA